MIPLVDSSRPGRSLHSPPPWLAGPLRYVIAVLALVATGVAGYLTWQTLGQKPIAGCGGSTLANCDDVLGSPWSKFLGMPVSAPAVALYLVVFVLSLLASVRNERARQAVGTLLAMLSLVAAIAAVWFIVLQVFVLQKYCPFCFAVHLCGLLIAGLVWGAALQNRLAQRAASQPAVALAGALASNPRRPPQPASRAISRPAPSLGWASAGALVLTVVLIGGQIAFPPQTYDISEVALDESVKLTHTASAPSDDAEDNSAEARDPRSHVVNRVPAENPTASDSPENRDETNGVPSMPADGGQEHVDEDAPNAEQSDEDASPADDTSAPPAANRPAEKREVKFLGGKLTVDVYSEAVLGSRDAPYVIIELLDYTCPHCRQMHKLIERAIGRYGSQLAIVVMPVPLEFECNPQISKPDPTHRNACRLARLALAVAEVDPYSFADFHSYLLADEENVPPYGSVVIRAFRTVDRQKLSELTGSDEIEQRIQNYIRLLTALGNRQRSQGKSFGLPVQIVGDKILTGKFESADEMFEVWEAELGIEPW